METSIHPTVVRVRGFTSLELEIAEASLRRVINEKLPASRPEDNYELSFVPACDNENEHVALVEFRHGLPEFLLQLRRNPLDSWQVFIDELKDDLSFDRHFIGFTQLYDPDSSQDVIAECKSPRSEFHSVLTDKLTQHHRNMRYRRTCVRLMARQRTHA